MRRVAASIVACAAIPALPTAVAIAHLNRLGFADAVIVGAWLWQLSLVLMAGPLALTAGGCYLVGRPCGFRELGGLALAGLFAFFWACRLEPVHQPLSIRPHISLIGVLQIALIAGLSGLVLVAAWSRRGRVSVAIAAVVAAAGSVLMLLASTVLVEPARDRTAAVTSLATMVAEPAPQGSPSGRVLILGIDGLEWRAIERLVRTGRTPTLARLIANGRFYQLDNRRMAISPQIWTALYTGRTERDNLVGGFEAWHFTGASRPVIFLPHFGVHPVWMLDLFLARFQGLGGWTEHASTTVQIRTPPLWTLASAEGRRVAVFDPVPFRAVGEQVRGIFVWPGDEGFKIASAADDDDPAPVVAVEPYPDIAPHDPDAEDRFERARVELAARLFAETRPDLAIYYTHALDSLSHHHWDFRLRDSWFGGDPQGYVAEPFDGSPIAEGYERLDAALATLVSAFGEGTVVLVSDHGWSFSDYEHFLSPYGVLVIAHTGAAGYGGVADVLSVAPTVLSLLGVPADARMQRPLADVTGPVHAPRDYSTVRREFIFDDNPLDEAARRRLLESLGYFRAR
ncbi:MAG: alkaline phosphatase family protein [Acidobacteriota bacterium]